MGTELGAELGTELGAGKTLELGAELKTESRTDLGSDLLERELVVVEMEKLGLNRSEEIVEALLVLEGCDLSCPFSSPQQQRPKTQIGWQTPTQLRRISCFGELL